MPLPFVQPDETKRSYFSGPTGLVKQLHVGTIVFDPIEYASYALAGFKEVAAQVPVANDSTVRSVSFGTRMFGPPYKVTVRTSVDWNTDVEGKYENRNWVFRFPEGEHAKDFEMKFMLHGAWMEGDNLLIPASQPHRHFTELEVFFPACKIVFRTKKWQPNHLVTLRNSDDGWGRDIFGVYAGGAWTFLLDRAKYPASFEAKLVLDRHLFMGGDNLQIVPEKWLYKCHDPIPCEAEDGGPPGEYCIDFPAEPTAYRHGYDNFLSIESPLEQITVRAKGSELEDYDVIIIGSGMGGGVLADALSERGARTLVLDAGGLWFPVHMCELPRIDIDLPERDQLGHFNKVGETKLWNGVHFNLGGRSVYWSGLIPRMSNWEMRDAWPESVRRYLTEPDEEGLSGYDRAEKLMRKGKTLGPYQVRVREHLCEALGSEFNVIDLPRSLHQPNMDEDGALQNVLEKPTGVFSTTDLLLDSLGYKGRAGRDNLRINLHHLATRIETLDQQATSVVCQDLAGIVSRERTYRGQFIVLACGSLESAKLALNSGLNDPNDHNEKMGHGLTDHPTYFYQREHDLPNTGPMAWIGDSRGHAKILIQHKAATPTDHAYNIELLINPKYWDTRHADDDLWDELVENQPMSKVKLQFKFDSNLDLNNYIKPMGVGTKPNVFVKLNPPTSAFNDEIVDYRNRILTALGVTDFTDHWIDEEWGNGQDGTVHHAGGTLRMSANGSGVVDENLKFRKYDNLYCCDLSVYPTIPAANPSLTLVALALRLAKTLGNRLGLLAAESDSPLV